MEDPAYLREKAQKCRRLAAELLRQDDPVRLGLLALAQEFEAKAVAAEEPEPRQPMTFDRRPG